MNMNDIDRIYTEQVTGLLNRGYRIHPATMGGSQGEWAHTDLTDGSEIIRVLIDSRCSFDRSYGDIVTITVGRCTDRISGRHGIIWNDHLEVLSEIELAKISETFYTTLEESCRMAEKRFARWQTRRGTQLTDLGNAHKSIALRWLRRQPRMKTCRLEDIEKMVRTTLSNGRVCFQITARGKTYSLHA